MNISVEPSETFTIEIAEPSSLSKSVPRGILTTSTHSDRRSSLSLHNSISLSRSLVTACPPQSLRPETNPTLSDPAQRAFLHSELKNDEYARFVGNMRVFSALDASFSRGTSHHAVTISLGRGGITVHDLVDNTPIVVKWTDKGSETLVCRRSEHEIVLIAPPLIAQRPGTRRTLQITLAEECVTPPWYPAPGLTLQGETTVAKHPSVLFALLTVDHEKAHAHAPAPAPAPAPVVDVAAVGAVGGGVVAVGAGVEVDLDLEPLLWSDSGSCGLPLPLLSPESLAHLPPSPNMLSGQQQVQVVEMPQLSSISGSVPEVVWSDEEEEGQEQESDEISHEFVEKINPLASSFAFSRSTKINESFFTVDSPVLALATAAAAAYSLVVDVSVGGTAGVACVLRGLLKLHLRKTVQIYAVDGAVDSEKATQLTNVELKNDEELVLTSENESIVLNSSSATLLFYALNTPATALVPATDESTLPPPSLAAEMILGDDFNPVYYDLPVMPLTITLHKRAAIRSALLRCSYAAACVADLISVVDELLTAADEPEAKAQRRIDFFGGVDIRDLPSDRLLCTLVDVGAPGLIVDANIAGQFDSPVKVICTGQPEYVAVNQDIDNGRGKFAQGLTESGGSIITLGECSRLASSGLIESEELRFLDSF